jgi:hypothetical protein
MTGSSVIEGWTVGVRKTVAVGVRVAVNVAVAVGVDVAVGVAVLRGDAVSVAVSVIGTAVGRPSGDPGWAATRSVTANNAAATMSVRINSAPLLPVHTARTGRCCK